MALSENIIIYIFCLWSFREVTTKNHIALKLVGPKTQQGQRIYLKDIFYFKKASPLVGTLVPIFFPSGVDQGMP